MKEVECLLDEDTTIAPNTIVQQEHPTPSAETSFKDQVLLMVTQRQRPPAPNPHIIQTANRNRKGFSYKLYQ